MSRGAWLLQNGVIAAVAVGALLIVFRFWRPRPAIEHLLWLTIALKLVLPPVAPLSLPADAAQGAARFIHAAHLGQLIPLGHDHPRAEPASPAVTSTNTSPAVLAAVHSATAASDGGVATLPWGFLLAVVWTAGALLRGGWLVARYVRFRSLLEIDRAPDDLRALGASVAADMRVDLPMIMTSMHVATPVVVGIARPLVVWPQRLRLPADRKRTVMAHELAHVRRRDPWLGPLELLVGAVWWWYPAWWLIRRRLRDAAERACDGVVLDVYPQHRRAYAEALLDVLSLDARDRPAFGLGVDGPGPVRRRLELILRADAPAVRDRRAYQVIACAALILMPSWTNATSDAQPVPPGAASSAPERAPTRVVEKLDLVGVASRGVVRFGGSGALPELEPDGWFIAFAGTEAGSIRRLELRRDGDDTVRVRNRVGERDAPVDHDVAVWLRDIMERSGYRPGATRARRSATAASVPDGVHSHRTDGSEMLALWSATPQPFGVNGTTQNTADRDRPVFMVYQARSSDPVVVLTVNSSADSVRVLDASVDAAAVSDDAEAARWLRTLLDRAVAWGLRR